MKLPAFKTFIKLPHILSKTNDINNLSKSKLSANFSLYIKNDKRLALSMLDNGFKPTFLQQQALNYYLSKEAMINQNFIDKYAEYFPLICDKAFINYLTHHILSTKCKNDKAIYENYSENLMTLKNRNKFTATLKNIFINNINAACHKTLKIKPYISEFFKFDEKQKKTYNQYILSIYNTLILLPLIFNDINDFVEIKNTISNSIDKIKDYLESYHKKSQFYQNTNNICFKIQALNSWADFLNNYDTSNLSKHLLAQTKEKYDIKNQEVSNNTILDDSAKNDNLKTNPTTEKILELSSQLNLDTNIKVINLTHLYNQLKLQASEKLIDDINNLYQDILVTIQKFVTIDPSYRTTLRNIEGKFPEQLMIESLDLIENKFNAYISDLNQDKVTSLSIQQRLVKMKTS